MTGLINNTFNMNMTDWGEFYTFLARFGLHILFILIIVKNLYYKTSKRKDYFFTYLLISTTIFLLCSVLGKVNIELGLALGLFAVFGIIRYRTSQIPIREMTYLFIVIGMAVINALGSTGLSFYELLFANGSLIFFTWVLERIWTVNHVSRKVVQYDKIELIKPNYNEELKKDLRERLGLNILRVEVGKVDFLKDTAKLIVFYEPENRQTNIADDIDNFSYDTDED